MLLGVVLLREKLRPWQWAAVGAATAGVLYLTFIYGSLPWIALTLAFTFGFYGLIKKTAPLKALDGLFLETALLFLPAFGFLLFQETSGVGAFGYANLTTHLLLILTGVATGLPLLLILTGVATGLPLLLFAAAARLIPLTTIGILQYLAPTIQFLLGVFLYGEAFTPTRLIGFSLIWLALLIYTVESVVAHRRTARAASLQYAG